MAAHQRRHIFCDTGTFTRSTISGKLPEPPPFAE